MPRKKTSRKKTFKNVQHKKKLSKRRTGKSKTNAKTTSKTTSKTTNKTNDFKMMSYKSQYSNVDGKVNRMERKVVSDNEKTKIWERKNDKVTKKTIRHKKSKKRTPSKVELKILTPLSSFELPHLVERDPFYDFVYSPNIFFRH
tara:strand:- start:193 stop:624 length:432 start_codon:yes stop_codon:yes gene_type:complete